MPAAVEDSDSALMRYSSCWKCELDNFLCPWPPYLKTAVQDQDPNPVLCSAMEQASVVILLDDRLQHAKDTFNRGAVTWLMSSVSKPKEAA